jgi:hypothetical protein
LTQDPRDLISDLSASPSSSSDTSDSGDSDKEEAIPPKEISEDSLLEGRLIRKKTMPSVHFSRKTVSQSELSVPEKTILIDRSVQVGSSEQTCVKMDRGTQISPKKRVVVLYYNQEQAERY